MKVNSCAPRLISLHEKKNPKDSDGFGFKMYSCACAGQNDSVFNPYFKKRTCHI